MTGLAELCRCLGFRETCINSIMDARLPFDEQTEHSICRNLCDPAAYKEQQSLLEENLGEDMRGWKQLKILLTAALSAREAYQQRGIDDAVFLSTMRCFARFSEEYRQAYGVYGFDRGFWVGRQLSLTLFRLGELEYELCGEGGQRAVWVHIPSDAVLSEPMLDRTFAQAKAFLMRHFPAFVGSPFLCRSWLLSPALQGLLRPDSRILGFQRRFEIEKVFEGDTSYRHWVFNTASENPDDWPENTSLQRNMKRFVRAGGKVGEATGILRNAGDDLPT